MGVNGLLPQLRSITRRAHVSKYAGQTVAVDAYCLLHRGAYTCSRELVEGEPTDKHIAYCMARVELLLSAGVKPLVVFDGGRLPNKLGEERSRQQKRDENRARARSLWAAGNKAAAMECYQRSVDITPAHAKQFVEALKRRGVPFIVAPYEADAQMAYLALTGQVDVVLTEDSDLLCYGCPTVFFKMDKVGEGEEVQLADLPAARELAFQGFPHDLFQEMCVLAGCDFADSLPGIGIKKAHQHLRRSRCFLKVVRSLRFDGCKVPEGYERRVQRALWTFRHQRIYCPRRRAVVHLHEIPGGDLAGGARVPAAAQLEDGEPDFLGPALPDEVAQAIAAGDLDPITKEPFAEQLQPCTAPLAADAAASGCQGHPSLRVAPPGPPRRSGQQQQQGAQQRQSGAAAGTATLMSFGFVRGLAKPAPADFRPPRATSAQPGSQDSGEASTASASAPVQRPQQPRPRGQASPPPARQPAGDDALGNPTAEQWEKFRQQLQQQQRSQQRQRPQQQGRQDEQEGEEEEEEPQQRRQAVAPPAKPPPAGDALLSPTDEQWQKFRQRISKGIGKAAGRTGSAKAPGSATSSFFAASKPAVPGMRKPGSAPSGGGLLARLRSALQPAEPSMDELLGRAAGGADGASGSEQLDEEEEEPRQQLPTLPGSGQKRQRFRAPQRQQWGEELAPSPPQQQPQDDEEEEEQWLAVLPSGQKRPRFVVPQAQQQQQRQQQRELLQEKEEEGEEEPRPALLGSSQRRRFDVPLANQQLQQRQQCSPLAQPRPSQRAWLPQPGAAAAAQQQQQPLIDLLSPAGPPFLEATGATAAQPRQQVTPGFYFGGSEAGSEPRQLTSLLRQPAAPSPGSAGSPGRQGQVPGSAGGRTAAALQPCFDAAAPPTGGDAGRAGASAGDPISGLGHLAACQIAAEAAVERAAGGALAQTSKATLRALPAPAYLRNQQQQQRQSAAAVAAGIRALRGEKEKAAGGPKSKRTKADAENLFVSFACSAR